MTEPRVAATASRLRPSLGGGAGLCLVAAAWVIGLRSLKDNSFFTHLATGRLILDTGSVPSVDPYTFTAAGEPWVVQSWLASALYGSVESVAGAGGLRILMGCTAALLTALAWRLSRPATSLLVRLGIGGLFVVASAEMWSERPFMLGLVAMACVVLAADGDLDPRWLVPIAWVWVNVHGSFPLGVAYVVVVAVGRRLDGASPMEELRALRWLVLGIFVGAIGPVGPKLLVFPLELVQRQDLLREVTEWRAPTFDTLSQRAFVVQLTLAVVLLVRRPSYRGAMVVALFSAAALLGARNLTVASLLMVPTMAACAPVVGSMRASDRNAIARLLAAAGLALGAIVGAARLSDADFNLDRYPVDAMAYLEEHQVDLTRTRMAAPDIVGNYLELVHGPGQRVFYDDRFDMFPEQVSRAHLALFRTDPSLLTVVEEHDIDLLTWGRTSATGQRLIADPGFRVLYTDAQWVVVCRRGSSPGGRLDRC